VLARLESLPGVDRAEAGYHGDLLKLAVHDENALGQATALLAELGYRAEVATDADTPAVDAWYDINSTGELSRVEAGVIADRIVPPFASARSLDAARSALVRGAVVDALHACFVKHQLGSGSSLGAFRSSCERAVEEGVRPIVGADPATALARLLQRDMSEDYRSR
jgi:hypothetical protein